LYVLGWRAPAAEAEATREQFEKMVASMRFSAAL
jgi:hypothetical protein